MIISQYKINDIAVYKSIIPVVSSNMYIMLVGKRALVIDPNESEEAVQLLKEQHIEQVMILLTHEHFDHISGVNLFRKNWDCTVYGNNRCKERAIDSKKNLSSYYTVLFMDLPEEERKLAGSLFRQDYSCEVDVGFDGMMDMEWEGLKLHMVETPGHSPGSICISMDRRYIFTGDSLIDGRPVSTVLPGGNRTAYYEFTKPFLERLSEDVIIFPGHGKEGVKSSFNIK